ncbi:hypothetical protein DFR67_12644 [Williamsia limnetica]|uniref:DUF8175 domain-containing protein n=2 Tax=Williamsia limnetica TaxID=882452 RepID=A0A318RDQ9_WILLI|nr:hypothetical protein DFR67_12644 [Williamsia limnetica]
MMGTPLAAMPPDDEFAGTRRWYRRPLWLIVLAVVVIAALIVAVAQTTGGSDDDAQPPVSTPTSTPPVSNGQDGYLPDTVDRFGQQIRVPRDPAGLALPQRPPSSPRSRDDAASGVQWQQVYDYGVAVYSTSDGPSTITATGLAQGIAHTPQGSVIAASQILSRIFYGPPQVRRAVMDEQVIGPPSAMTALAELQLPANQYPADRFIRVDPQYSDTFSRVMLASGPKASSQYPSGQYYVITTMTMVWDQGQWKWRIPDDGFSETTRNTPIESVAGWTQW